jgi:NitT/TauT family transport system substrate-binding protein
MRWTLSRKIILGFGLGWLILVAAYTSPAQPPPLTPVTLQLSFTHQAQFAGFYVADQKGYYAQEGLTVTFIEGGTRISPWTRVVGGEAQFGVTSGDQLLLARAAGGRVQALATLYRRNPRVFIALAESGITRPQNFVGKKIAVNAGGSALLDAMMHRVGINRDQYTVIDSSPDLAKFYAGEEQVRSVFLNNEVLVARAAGYKLNIIYLDDYGIRFYADSLFASDDFISQNSDLVLRFTRASLKGWTFAVENPSAIGAMVAKYNPNANAALENAKMTASLPLINTGEDHIGWMKPEIWSGMEKTLREQGVLTKTLTLTNVYAMQFLKEIYP